MTQTTKNVEKARVAVAEIRDEKSATRRRLDNEIDLDIFLQTPHKSPPVQTDAIERLEAWKNGHKSRYATIRIDNGYGACCWIVELYGNGKSAVGLEVAFYEGEPKPYIAIAPNPDDDWPGLSATIHAAVDKAEKLGL